MNAIDKVFHLLEQFTSEKSQWGVTELAAKAGLSPNLTHWYLKNLERHRVVVKNPETDKYQLGYKLYEFGTRVTRLRHMKDVASPILKRLSEVTHGTAVLRIIDGHELLCLASVQSPSSLRLHFAEGSRVPCNFGCVGKLLMAYLPEEEAEILLAEGNVKRFTRRTITERTVLKKEWARIRVRGWAYTNGEAIDGARAVAAPVRGSDSEVCAGLGLTFPAVALPSPHVKAVAKEVVEAADAISSRLGWESSSSPRRLAKGGR